MKRSLWREPDFLKLWLGQTISEAGSRITREGVPLTAVMMLHASPLDMGLLAALGGIATLVFGPVAGLFADRHRLRPILINADLGRALVISIIPVAAFMGQLRMWNLYIVVAAAGILTVFFDVSYQSLLPSLVDRDQLLEGNSKLSLSTSTAEAVGPAFSGALIQWLTAPVAMIIDAISFLVSAASLAVIRKPEIEKTHAHREPSLHELSAGFRFVFPHPILRPLAMRAVTTAFFWGFFWALYVIYAIDYLKFTPFLLGIVVTLGGISSFIGSSMIPFVTRRFEPRTTLIAATLVAGFSNLLIPLAPGPGIWAILCMGGAQLLGDISFPIYNVEELTIRQRISPPEVLGRVNAAMQMLFRGVLPIGALAGGTLAQEIGVRRTLWVCSIGVLISVCWLIFSPVRKLTRDSLEN